MNEHAQTLIALDMDGTLLNSDHIVSERNRQALFRAARAGHYVALATGRTLSEILHTLEILPCVTHIVGENGAAIWSVRPMERLYRVNLSKERARRVLDTVLPYDPLIQMFIGDQSYLDCAPNDDLTPFHIEEFRPVFEEGSIFRPGLIEYGMREGAPLGKINAYFRTPQQRDLAWAAATNASLEPAKSIGLGAEFSPDGISKGRGLMALCEILRLPLSQTIAFGDGGNDLDLLSTAGIGVAMGNASDEVKAHADQITEDCDHDGVANALNRLIPEL